MIDEVKPPAGNRPISDPSLDATVEQKGGGNFAEAKDKLQSAGGSDVSNETLRVAGDFTRAALQDPAKLDYMVRASVSELIDSGVAVTGSLAASQKGMLVDFLSGDPLVRQHIQNYLRKVLS
jgi:hypothetical protein